MREHKFRAYNTLNKKMYDRILVYKDFLAQYDTTPTGQHTITILSKQGDSVSPFVPLEFSGIKDANNVDVYEGDIISFVDLYGHTKTRVIQWNRELAKFEAYHDGNYTRLDILFEVIGNIYENPELLEGEK